MNKEWQDRFTVGSEKITNAQADAAGNISFGSHAQPSEMAIAPAVDGQLPVLVELSRLAVVDIEGEDAAEFLQAQVCNDLTTLAADQLQLNGYCSPKGRLMTLFTVFGHNEGYRLVLPDDIAPAFIKRLQMFVMRAKVSITPRTDLVCTGLVIDADASLPNAAIPESFPALPDTVLSWSSNDNVQLLRWHDDTGNTADNAVGTKEAQKVRARYLSIGTPDTLFPLWQSDQFSHAAWPLWRWGDINAGIPNVFAASTDQFIPQMVNMQLINALSFKKGCYPGQEIVARMQYLGKLKKHTKHLYQPGATQIPEPATTLTTESNNNAGQIVDAVMDENGLNLLAVVNIATPVSELQLGGLGLQEASVPYSLVSVDDKSADKPGAD